MHQISNSQMAYILELKYMEVSELSRLSRALQTGTEASIIRAHQSTYYQ
jgi:hypothetical protein